MALRRTRLDIRRYSFAKYKLDVMAYTTFGLIRIVSTD
jgi:hypothetical protein